MNRAPRSIDEYLKQLRQVLQGADDRGEARRVVLGRPDLHTSTRCRPV